MSETNETEEISHPYIAKIEWMSKTERKKALRSLVTYGKSDEFAELVKYCENECKTIENRIFESIKWRNKTECTKSEIDQYYEMYKWFIDISKKSTNEVFSEYLTEYRAESAKSNFIKWRWYSAGFQVMVDAPIFTDIDMLKQSYAVYNSINQFLSYAISMYDKEWAIEEKEVQEENKYQPYE